MRIAIITTGDEIMSGNLVDSNTAWISDHCWILGHEVVWHFSVADDKRLIGEACRLASERADLVFVSGGLGATLDDITLEAAAATFGKEMVFHDEIWTDIKDYFKRRGRECTENNKRQAYIPAGGKPLANKVGTAPGVQVKLGSAIFFFLPGVPRELYQIFSDSIIPWLKESSSAGLYSQRFLKCFGIPEASFDEKIKDLDLGDVRLSFRVVFPEVRIKLVTREKNGDGSLARVENEIHNNLGDYIYGTGDETLEGVVGNLLVKKSYKLSVAESCTGGLISNLITNVSGASKWFEHGVVSYSNESKQLILGVKEATIKKYGAVSEECVCEMAEGVRKIRETDFGIAVSGIAGPTGGTSEKPVGTVYIALATSNKTVHVHHLQPLDRERFKLLVAYQALDMVRRELI